MERRKNRGLKMFLAVLYQLKKNSKFLKMHQGMSISNSFLPARISFYRGISV